MVAVRLVAGQAEELLIAGSIASGLVGELLPGIVFHLQHHGLHVGSKGSKIFVGSKRLVAERLNVGLQRGAGLVIKQVVQVLLEGGLVLYQIVVVGLHLAHLLKHSLV